MKSSYVILSMYIYLWNFFWQEVYFYFQNILVENGIPSLQRQWDLFGDKETQLWSQFPWITRVTAHCVHGLDKAMSMQRKELTGGEGKQKIVSF